MTSSITLYAPHRRVTFKRYALPRPHARVRHHSIALAQIERHDAEPPPFPQHPTGFSNKAHVRIQLEVLKRAVQCHLRDRPIIQGEIASISSNDILVHAHGVLNVLPVNLATVHPAVYVRSRRVRTCDIDVD